MIIDLFKTQIEDAFAQHLQAVRRFIQMPSISHTGQGMAETADYCVQFIRQLGGTAKLHPGVEYPVVYGELNVGAPRTVLVYSMYDVQPAAEPDWVSPPFAAEIRDWQGLGPCIVGRGAVNTKGPLQAFFNVVQMLVQSGTLPVNLMFAIEGEEERGSASMPGFVAANREALQKADAVLFPFFCQEPNGTPLLYLGVKGMLQMELVAQGGDRGGPTVRDIHGGNASWMHNPAWRLVHALSHLVDADEQITIPGFADSATGPSADDLALLADLEHSFDPRAHLTGNQVRRFRYPDTSTADLMRHLLFDPTCNISGLGAGYMGPGFMTLLPHKATARMDVRLVPGMVPSRVIEAIRTHLDNAGLADVSMDVQQAYPASKVPVSDPVAQAAVRMYRSVGRSPAIWPIMHGCAPLYLFTDIVQRPWITAGLGHGGRQHSSNEYCTVAGIKEFELSMLVLLHELAGVFG